MDVYNACQLYLYCIMKSIFVIFSSPLQKEVSLNIMLTGVGLFSRTWKTVTFMT